MSLDSNTSCMLNESNAFTSFTALIIITVLIVTQFVYESIYGSFFCDKSFVYTKDVTKSEAGRPITEIIVDF